MQKEGFVKRVQGHRRSPRSARPHGDQSSRRGTRKRGSRPLSLVRCQASRPGPLDPLLLPSGEPPLGKYSVRWNTWSPEENTRLCDREVSRGEVENANPFETGRHVFTHGFAPGFICAWPPVRLLRRGIQTTGPPAAPGRARTPPVSTPESHLASYVTATVSVF